MTGHAEPEVLGQLTGRQTASLLRKPIVPVDLIDAIQARLSSNSLVAR